MYMYVVLPFDEIHLLEEHLHVRHEAPLRLKLRRMTEAMEDVMAI